jgi:hypothetical protein
MPRPQFKFTYADTDATRIPDAFTESVVLLSRLRVSGLLAAIGERIRIWRQGGFPGLDIVVLLLVFFASGIKKGVKTVWDEELRKHHVQIAATAGRKKLTSPSAFSRALDAVEPGLIRPGAAWLLGECSGVDEVMKHPASGTWDVLGQRWDVFDLDPTVTTLRHRALPEDDDLPEPRRRSQDTGAPGYSGRKRGDLQFRRTTVQHAGASAWLHAHLSPGNGELLVDLGLALDTIVATCDRLSVARSRALVRMDGEYGHVPAITACRERELPLLGRLNRDSLYDDPVLLGRLQAAHWQPVIDSLSGPRRLAADMGDFTLAPGKDTRRADGSEYDPVSVRIVASIYEDTGNKGRGRCFDGWRVELFIAALPADAWPAEDCVSVYFGRSAEENRFAQEDRELGLDRIISYHLPGQELATVVGLFLWNLRLVHGFHREPPPEQVPPPRLRTSTSAINRPPAYWPPDPKIVEQLGKVDWEQALANRPGWSWSETTGALRCPDGRDMYITCVPRRQRADGRRSVIFRRLTGGCEDCEERPGCYTTIRERGAKHVELLLPADVAASISDRLAVTRQAIRGCTKSPLPRRQAAVTPARFLPAEARAAHRECLKGATLRIKVESPGDTLPPPRLVAIDDAFIQRRRKTWQQRVDDYALPKGARVEIHVEASQALRSLLGDTAPGRVLGASGGENHV